MKTAYIGIDPGASGGIAIVGKQVHAFKMPDTERDLFDVFHNLTAWHDEPTFAMIERVHAMPKQGVSSTFTFGRNYGGLRMALIASGIPFEEVTPQAWQKHLSCLTGGNKNVSKAKAQQLFPSLKITHAIADALLIAEYARRTHSTP